MAQKKQETALTGLSDKEVLISREKYGNNLLTPPKRPSMWKLYLEKFRDPVIRILLVAAFFSLVIAIIENEYAETIGIFFAIFLATGIGFYFEYDANKKFDLLNAVGEETPVTVIRNGKVREIPRKEIVVGDIVVLNTGEEIPADGILLEAISLQVNESNLTGELMVNKTIHEELEESKKPLLTVLQEALDGEVKEVVLSKRLTTSPVCLVSGDGLSFEMEELDNVYYVMVDNDFKIMGEEEFIRVKSNILSDIIKNKFDDINDLKNKKDRYKALLDELNVCQKRFPLYKNVYLNYTNVIKKKI